jgi:large subunit ribosomal protein L29
MKAKELRQLNKEELFQKLKDLKQELFNLRFQLATSGRLSNIRRIREVKKDIARILTIFRERGEKI